MRLFLFFMFLVVLSFSCSTQKQKGDVSKFKKFYHNTTALYNGYFNANVLLEESTYALESQVTDNYNKPLEVFKYAAAENPASVYDNLDRAIEKVSVVVHLHRVSDWTDDSYLLMGKAQFLKQDYESAQETFEYFIQEFDETGQSKSAKKKIRKAPSKSDTKARAQKASSAKKAIKAKEKAADKARKEREKQRKQDIKSKQTKKSKKVDPRQARAIREARREQAARDSAAAVAAAVQEELEVKNEIAEPELAGMSASNNSGQTPSGNPYAPDSYFLKHKPCYQEGMLWLAKTYVMRANYDNARMYLKQLENSPKTFKEIRAEVAATEALSYMKQKNYAAAVAPIAKAAELTSSRAERARYLFILAQLQELSGNYANAAASFERVVKIRPNFEMEFHARMGVIRTEQLAGIAAPNAVASEVKRMLRERKFEEFKGELHLTMAFIRINEGNKEAGMESLKLALEEGRNNPTTNAEIYYLLGQLNYEKEKYIAAKAAYDGALSTMHKNDERYPTCERRANSLSDIAANLSIIMEKDSLLKVAGLSDAEKLALAKEIKAKRESDLLAGSQKTDKKANPTPTYTAVGNRPLFFAYDQRNVSKNRKDFDRVWQNRPLEDNWRRSNKNTSSLAQSEEEEEEGATTRGTKMSAKELEDLLAGVPSSDADILAAEKAIMEAMYKLGGLFNDKLDRLDKSVFYLESMLERFPDNPHIVEAYYRLYVSHKMLGDIPRSDYYKNLILNDYSSSLFAEVIRDPDYFRKKREEENKLNNYYASTYKSFTGGDYSKAFDMSNQATQVFGAENNLKAKFALLRAMCIGKLQGADEYNMALREVIARYPNSEEQVRAREILRLLGQRIGPGPGEPEVKPKISSNVFTATDSEMHYIIVILNSPDLSLNDAKVRLSNYNNKYHRLDQLKISNIVLGEKNNIPVVVLRRFENKASAMKYFDNTKKNSRDFLTNPAQYEMFAISQTNYRQLITIRSIEPYREFFIANYL